MKLIGVVNSIDKITDFPLDGIILGTTFSSYAYHYFQKEEIKKAIVLAKKVNKEIFLLINSIMHCEKEAEISKFIDCFKDEDVKFIFQDLGIFNILMKKGIIYKGIYNPLTMITNAFDMHEYTILGCDAVGVSNEITLDDVVKINAYDNNVFYLGFGYHPMYQTYRKIISLYKEESKLDIELDNLFLQENTRKEDRCPTIENEYGTIVFRNGVISVLERLLELDLKYLFLDSIFINEDIYYQVINIYKDVYLHKLELQEGINRFNQLNLPINNQFMYVDSVYNPKEFE